MTGSDGARRTAARPTPVRAALLIDHPVQHFAPGLRMLASRRDVTTYVYYWTVQPGGRFDPGFGRHVRWHTDLYSGYEWWSPPAGRPAWRRATAVIRHLRRARPDVVLCFGWSSAMARLGILFAALARVPLLYYGDSNPNTPVSGWRRVVKRPVLRVLLRAAAGAVSTGAFNRDFYLLHGLPARHIHPGVLPADVGAFRPAEPRRRPGEPAGDAGRPLVIGFAGKLVKIKGADDLIEAAARLPREQRWQVWLIGDGPQRPSLQSLVERRHLSGRVRFLGFRNTDELPSLMRAIDIMVMPSRREPRGLVAVEAMAAGAATVVSSATGLWGAGDVIQHEQSGLVFPAGDVDALVGCLRRLMEDTDLRVRMAACGQRRAMSYGPRDFAATTAAALTATVRRGRS